MLTEKNVSNTTVWTRTNNYNFSENNYLRSHNELHDVTLDASGNKAYYVYDSGDNRVRKVVEKGNIVEERFYIGNYEYFTKTTNGSVEEERETVKISDDKQVIALIDKNLTTHTHYHNPRPISLSF